MSLLRKTRLIIVSMGILWWLPLAEKHSELLSFLSQLLSHFSLSFQSDTTLTIKVTENQDHCWKCYKNYWVVTSFVGTIIFIQESQQSFYSCVSFTDFSGAYSWKHLFSAAWCVIHTSHNALLTLWVTAPAQFTRPCSLQCQEECRRRLTTSSWVAALSWFCSSEPTYGSCSQSESGGTWHLCPGKQSYITTPTLQTSQWRTQMSFSKANNPQLLLKTSHPHYQNFSKVRAGSEIHGLNMAFQTLFKAILLDWNASPASEVYSKGG